MPWRGPNVPGAFPTLGYLVIEWIENWCVIPDGDHAGEPYLLTDEQARFVLWMYRLHPETGAWVYSRGGQLVRPQKQGKGPFSASLVCAEAEGPVRFDGWDASGEPVGRPWPTPWIQLTAVSEDQTANVNRALLPMIELGPLTDLIPDTGQTRINLRGGGRIEPVTAEGRSRLGQRITFAVNDETHSWLKDNGGWKLADAQRRNLAGMGGRFLETTNAWDPAEQSVAQLTFESAAPGVYKDYPEPPPGSIRNKRERRKVLKAVYGDSHWVDLDRIEIEIEALLARDPAQAERFFLNRSRAAEDAAFDLEAWERCKDTERTIAPGSLIVIGLDGARYDDAIALIATDVDSGHQWPLGIWERPDGAGDEYEHPLDELEQVVDDAFRTFNVWRLYADSQHIEHVVDRLQGRWGEKRVVEWLMSRHRQTAWATRNYIEAVGKQAMSHSGDATVTRHIGNAKRHAVRVYDEKKVQMFVLGKDRPLSPRKIDGAAAGVLSWEARGDCIAAGADNVLTAEAVW